MLVLPTYRYILSLNFIDSEFIFNNAIYTLTKNNLLSWDIGVHPKILEKSSMYERRNK